MSRGRFSRQPSLDQYTYDAHGSVVAMNGQSYEYDAFGNILENNVTVSNPFRYNGEYYDEESGLIYLRNRYYDPSMGRFTSEDPAKDGVNWYVFCSNDPVMFVDPWGLDDYLVVLASGINSNRSDDAWKSMSEKTKAQVSQVVAIGSPKTVVTDGQWKTTYIGDPNDSITYTDPLGFSPGEQYAPDYYYEIDNGVHVPEVTGITEVGEYIRTSLFEVHTSYFNTYEKAAKILDKFWDRI